mgnify:FL=1
MIYLDSAATTLEKPPEVSAAVARAIGRCASPGRGEYPASAEAGEVLFRCRELAAELFDVPAPDQVVFTCNATHALNLAIRSLVRPGTTVVISGYEHNAVTRTLHGIPDVTVRPAACPLFDRAAALAAFEQALEDGADAAVCSHVSNVFGFIQPIDAIAALCRDRGVPLIVDASQSAGTLPVSLRGWGAAFVAMPGHKGLYGPQGTGLLLCGSDCEPLLRGGTGSASLRQEMPDFLPDRLEAGTQNVCGVAGLLEGMRFVARTGRARILRHERRLCGRMMDLLEGSGAVVFRGGESQSGLFSFQLPGQDCEGVGERLAAAGIAVRAGLHCAPLAHQTAGTLEQGTVRVSPSVFTSPSAAVRAAEVIRQMAAGGIM